MRWIGLVLVAVLMGCASKFVVEDTDTQIEKERKIGARAGLAVVTLGGSEIHLAHTRRKEAERVHREEYQAAWHEEMKSVHTMSEITRLFGSAPDSCFSSSTVNQICTWTLGQEHVESGFLGFNYYFQLGLARSREAGWGVQAVCELPKDGSPREPDSCQLSFE